MGIESENRVWFLKYDSRKMPEPGTLMWFKGMNALFRWQGVPMIHRPSLFDHAAMRTVFLGKHLAILLDTLEDDKFQPDHFKVDRLATHHDDDEVVNGDLPTPNKLGLTPEERASLQLKEQAGRKAIGLFRLMLEPEDLKLYMQDQIEVGEKETLESQIVEAADKLDALGEILHEIRCGNQQFLDFVQLRRKVIADLERFEFWQKIKSHPTLALDYIPTQQELERLPTISIDSFTTRDRLERTLLVDKMDHWPMFYFSWLFLQYSSIKDKDIEKVLLRGWCLNLWERWGVPLGTKSSPGGIALRPF